MKLLLAFCLIAACRAPVSVTPIPKLSFENTTNTFVLGSESDILNRWNGPLKAAWESGERGEFVGVDGIRLRYVIHKTANSKGAVVLVPGRTEAVVKYSEVIDDFRRAGYSTYALDIRGQGDSDRLLTNRNKGHIVAFEDYVTDLHNFIQTVVRKDETKNIFIVAHSLGGAISTMLVDAFPNDVQALVLSAPMLEISTGSFPAPIAWSLGATACGATDGTDYAIGSGDYAREMDFNKNSVTRSENRWNYKLKQLDDLPNIRLGGVTWRFVCESLTASSAIQLAGKFSATPTLLLQAEEDTVVKSKGQNTYCADAPNCQLELMKESRHEILQETDAIRNKAMFMILTFLEARRAP
jgi:lysophospholipase